MVKKKKTGPAHGTEEQMPGVLPPPESVPSAADAPAPLVLCAPEPQRETAVAASTGKQEPPKKKDKKEQSSQAPASKPKGEGSEKPKKRSTKKGGPQLDDLDLAIKWEHATRRNKSLVLNSTNLKEVCKVGWIRAARIRAVIEQREAERNPGKATAVCRHHPKTLQPRLTPADGFSIPPHAPCGLCLLHTHMCTPSPLLLRKKGPNQAVGAAQTKKRKVEPQRKDAGGDEEAMLSAAKQEAKTEEVRVRARSQSPLATTKSSSPLLLTPPAYPRLPARPSLLHAAAGHEPRGVRRRPREEVARDGR